MPESLQTGAGTPTDKSVVAGLRGSARHGQHCDGRGDGDDKYTGEHRRRTRLDGGRTDRMYVAGPEDRVGDCTEDRDANRATERAGEHVVSGDDAALVPV